MPCCWRRISSLLHVFFSFNSIFGNTIPFFVCLCLILYLVHLTSHLVFWSVLITFLLSLSLPLPVRNAFRMRGRETPKHESLNDMKRKYITADAPAKITVLWVEKERARWGQEGEGLLLTMNKQKICSTLCCHDSAFISSTVQSFQRHKFPILFLHRFYVSVFCFYILL